MNEDYEPTDLDEEILAVLKDGRANPYLIRERTGESRQTINHRLNQLVAAGWVEKVVPGLYSIVDDPRG